MDEQRKEADAADEAREGLGVGASDEAQHSGLRLMRGRRGAGKAALPQLRRVGRRLWDEELKQQFLEVLAATCNVREACRVVGMTDTGAYKLRRRDAGFAAMWDEALEQGYSELEMLLLRQSIHGSTTTETVVDGAGQRKQVKTVHSYPHGMAMQLLSAHRKSVADVRAAQTGNQAGSEQIRAEIQVKIAAMRARVVEHEPHEENGGTSA